uniref:Cytochrome P450 n=2 Tax=Bemisia tabaci TaxID=7038 RepID=J7FTV7_BEMTA|nr:PREDICTED: cytochrome P450 4C1-like [Bemisia tabaci]XP_018901324.1 PREDICTED: cytochrome P450 4C1-like [Bemisia tabaci]AFP49818.1 cytochrome P450 [Bemisia tabaci]
MELITLMLTTTLLAFIVMYFFTHANKRIQLVRTMNKLPGPKEYPLVGNSLELAVPRNQFFKIFDDRTRKWGPIFRTWEGPLAVLHITRPEHAEIILASSKHIDKSLVYTFLHPWLGTGLLTGTGAKWHSHRKMITPTFHFKILDIFQEVFVEKCQLLVEKLKSKANNEPFDIYPFITRCALDIICETAMGTEINAQEKTDSDYVRAIYDISELTLKRSFQPWFWPDLVFNMTDYGKRYSECLSVLHGFTTRVIKERKALRSSSNGKHIEQTVDEDAELLGKKKRLAFLDLLLEASENSNGSALTDIEIREEVDTFMFEGHDTTTAGICWTLFLLGSHPEYQDKVAEELNNIFQGDNRLATMKDLNDMKYLERCIKDSLRLFPSVPFIGRTLKEDTSFDNYQVPKGTLVNLQIYHIHRCKDQWPNPEKFDPDNFLPERISKRHPYAYVPFSAGPRNCIGQKFALLEEKTMLSAVLRNYRVESHEKFEDLTLMNELILRPESGIILKLTPRS